MSTTRLTYPIPRYPDYLRPPGSSEDLMPQARKVVGGVSFNLVNANKVLLVVPPDQDRMVLATIRQALKEKAIDADVVFEHECGLQPPLELLRKVSAADGWNQVFWRNEVTAMLPLRLQALRPLTLQQFEETGFEAFRRFLDAHDQYDSVFYGWAVPAERYYKYVLGPHGSRFKGCWTFRTYEDLLSKMNDFPEDLWQLIEKKTQEVIPRVAETRVTDPQGTEIWFSVTEEEAKLWAQGTYQKGHLLMYPFSSYLYMNIPRALRGAERAGIICPRANGVIAGTGNHCGYYPHMRAYVEDGVVRRIEGGGLFGEMLREIMFKTKELQYPTYPRPGYFYLCEVALGTHPKAFRDTEGLFGSYRQFPNAGEKMRAGVLHWGIGIESSHPAVLQFAKERRVPHQHSWDIHNYMSTYEVELRDTGEWVKVIDRGHLTALDDPEVQALAAKHGVPSELLSEDWVPALPGINYPGDYMRDYGREPVSWIRKEQEGRLPATIGVP